MRTIQPDEIELKNLHREREIEPRRLERLKKVLQAKMALSEGKPPVGSTQNILRHQI